uniref:Sulfatase-modifying factor enzyme-like domain-containing protein n=1 Tax=Solibacter usitatus (strain Ellin6076) TaxID=234267 RepID=Q02D19_SOLUE
MIRLLLLYALAHPPVFVTIPAGSFIMGCEPSDPCAAGSPRHRVTFDHPFQMMKTEVTVRDFRAFVKATGYLTEAEKSGDTLTWRSPGFPLSPAQPVVFMTLNDATAYCSSIGARVPTEAEWEYAARAGATTAHYWGEEIDDRYVWYFNNTDQRPQPVARKLPNAWGLYDIEGNAAEWVTIDKVGSLRGGSYAACPEPYPPSKGVRQRGFSLGPTFQLFKSSSFRRDERRYDFGIRCAKP